MRGMYKITSPLLLKIAPELAGQPTPDVPGTGDMELEDIQDIGISETRGAEPAIQGQNVPMPEPSGPIRNQSMPPAQLTNMNDASSAGNQMLNANDAITNALGPESDLSPMNAPQIPTSPRPVQGNEDYQDFFGEEETEFAESTPQVDAIFGLARLRNRGTQLGAAQRLGMPVGPRFG